MHGMVRRATVAVFAASFVAAWSADSPRAVAQQALPGLRLARLPQAFQQTDGSCVHSIPAGGVKEARESVALAESA